MPNQRGSNTTQTSFTLPKHLLKWVQEQADKRGLKTSEYIRHLLLKNWDEHNIPKGTKK